MPEEKEEMEVLEKAVMEAIKKRGSIFHIDYNYDVRNRFIIVRPTRPLKDRDELEVFIFTHSDITERYDWSWPVAREPFAKFGPVMISRIILEADYDMPMEEVEKFRCFFADRSYYNTHTYVSSSGSILMIMDVFDPKFEYKHGDLPYESYIYYASRELHGYRLRVSKLVFDDARRKLYYTEMLIPEDLYDIFVKANYNSVVKRAFKAKCWEYMKVYFPYGRPIEPIEPRLRPRPRWLLGPDPWDP